MTWRYHFVVEKKTNVPRWDVAPLIEYGWYWPGRCRESWRRKWSFSDHFSVGQGWGWCHYACDQGRCVSVHGPRVLPGHFTVAGDMEDSGQALTHLSLLFPLLGGSVEFQAGTPLSALCAASYFCHFLLCLNVFLISKSCRSNIVFWFHFNEHRFSNPSNFF